MMNIKTRLLNLNQPLIDVRSEGEFKQGHIPNALNCPLLNNEERRLVGICYKTKGKDAALKLGYELVGDQFGEKLQQVRDMVDGNELSVYCWRGGLRSKTFSEILKNGGYHVSRLENGYKAFRHWSLEQVQQTYPITILGGNTGTGKTEILHELQNRGEQVIDLEALANHKGSTYGGIGLGEQPTQEQFENELAIKLLACNLDNTVWFENESRHLGKISLPGRLHEQMRNAKVIEIQSPHSLRRERIVNEYGRLNKQELIQATARLEKRLGNLKMNKAINHLQNNEFEEWVDILLVYYDKQYEYGKSLRKRENINRIEIYENNIQKTAGSVLKYYDELGDKHKGNTVNTI
jgi:tRNA 2-selenouridine synthase